MDKKVAPIGAVFIALGVCFLIIFRNSTLGMVSGILFIIAGLLPLIRHLINRG